MSEGAELSLSNPAAAAVEQGLVEHKIRLEKQIKDAAGWFFAIAALSLVNSVIMLCGSTWHFLVGLGVTTIFDAIALHLNNSVANVAVFVVNVIILAIPITVGVFARKGHKWAFIVGMVLYGLDGLLLLLFRDWFSLGFHIYALFMIYRGVTAIPMLRQVQEAMRVSSPSPAPIEP